MCFCVKSLGYTEPTVRGYGWMRAGVEVRECWRPAGVGHFEIREVRDRIEVSPSFLNLKSVPFSLAVYSDGAGSGIRTAFAVSPESPTRVTI